MNHSPQILFDRDAQSLLFFEEQLQELYSQGARGVTFLIGSQYSHTQSSMSAFLRRLSLNVSGGVFPEVIYHGEYYDDAMIAIVWFDKTPVYTFLEASDMKSDLYHKCEPIFEAESNTTSLVFSNTKTRAAEAALDALYYRSGQSTQYSGAGSAYAYGCDLPSIATNDGLVADALQIACFPYKQEAYVGHGWSVMSGPHLVTESEKNKVASLDYQPINDYYQSLVRNSVGEMADKLTLQEMIKRFPVGIQPYDEDLIVRDILGFDESGIEFIGDIPDFSNIYILSGEQENLLQYVRENKESFRLLGDSHPSLSVIISCVGRRIHMGERSRDELNILADSLKNSHQVVGMSSMGEIASSRTGLARLHSMSLVVASIWI